MNSEISLCCKTISNALPCIAKRFYPFHKHYTLELLLYKLLSFQNIYDMITGNPYFSITDYQRGGNSQRSGSK